MKKNRHTHKRLKAVGFWGLILGVCAMGGVWRMSHATIPCANEKTCRELQVEKIENEQDGFFEGRRVAVPRIDIGSLDVPSVLGESDAGAEKHIYVDLSKQTVYAYEGDRKIFETLVSTGRWGRTPTGNFHIWSKFRSTRMSGGSGNDAYDLPNVPYTMFFYGDFGLHGAYWHNNFGHTMSHGCVNLRPVDAKVLFEWADGPAKGKTGTAVSICDRFTGPSTCEQDHPVQ